MSARNLKFTVLFALVFGFFVTSCESIRKRGPSGQVSEETLQNFYKVRHEISVIEDRLEVIRGKDSREFAQEAQKLNEKKGQLSQIASSLRDLSAQGVVTADPVSVVLPFQERWRQHHDEFILHRLDPFLLGPQGEVKKKMFLTSESTKRVILQLTQLVYSFKDHKTGQRRYSISKGSFELHAKLSCNANVRVHLPLKIRSLQANEEFKFTWYDKKMNGQQPLIEMTDPRTECELRFGERFEPIKYGVKFVPEAQELARIGNPHLKSEICYIPNTDHLPPIERYFLDASQPNTTCPVKVDKWETLENSLEGINAKIKILTGQSLTEAFIRKGNALAQLDFSKAPKLDAILISYLVFRADFGGSLIGQALRYHAERGTLIRIAISDPITLGKDRQMLLDLASEYPNIKLLFFRLRPEDPTIKDWINSFHRGNHIKLFLTYSKDDPEANKIILGGRNIHDGFVFPQPMANYINPTVVDYNKGGDEKWARWEDFETLFTSQSLVESMMAQFFSVLHADYKTVHFRSFTENVKVKTPLSSDYLNLKENEVHIRSLVSVPYKDDMQLEKSFVQMIDSAQKEIKLSTPYFNLTQNLFDAFVRAADRGVNVELITRLDLKGDTADIVLGDVNKASVNKLYDKIKIYEYTTKGKILHTKLFMIDNRFVMMGSVNLNLRSFYHDIENATLVYGPGYNKKLLEIFEDYKKESTLLDKKQKTVFWKKILIKLIGTAL